jgi:dTDP-glucose 4,6-dehydratase
MAKKRILITGGAGFIGSHLCDHFLKKEFKVVCLDNFITGSKKNIAHLLPSKDFSLISSNISQKTYLPGKIDIVMHFASPASPPDYLKNPIATLKVGSLGTHIALGIAKEHHAKFMLASTSEVYGDPLVSPQPESYCGHVNPIGPRGVYDEAKRFSEAMTLAYHREHGIDTKIIRIFNTYGPRMRPEDGRVIPNFISQALLGKSLTVYGNGSQTRSYCYVDDLVQGIDKVLFSKLNTPVNLGNPNEMSVLKLAKLIIKLTGSKSTIVYKALPVDDPKQRCPNIAFAKKALKWAPKVALEDGLFKTIAYFEGVILKGKL